VIVARHRPQDVLVAWSGGKDSALALREILHDARYRVAALLTTVTGEYDRISMHGVRRTLLERQAASLGLPLEQVVISPGATNDEYEGKMAATLAALRDRVPGLDTVVMPRVRCRAAAGPAAPRGPLWRKRRVPHVRVCGPGVSAGGAARVGRRRAARPALRIL